MPRAYSQRSIGHWAPAPAERISCPQPYGQLDVHLPGQVACFPCSSGKGMHLACSVMSFAGPLACKGLLACEKRRSSCLPSLLCQPCSIGSVC